MWLMLLALLLLALSPRPARWPLCGDRGLNTMAREVLRGA
jgi:hypothetical protein